MKILVLQLARFGDILQTWPTLNALKRLHPDAEVHVLCRSRFQNAFDGLTAVDRLWTLDTQRLLSPLVSREPEIDGALEEVQTLVSDLSNQAFDKVINLSFSPVSSYLVKLLAGPKTEVVGYTRHPDGYLNIPDDPSAYFFAQVGPARANRLHLTDIFAAIAGVDLQPSDWVAPVPEVTSLEVDQVKEGAIVVHIGASQTNKTLGWMKWSQIVKGLCAQGVADVVLIGSKEESVIADKIVAACSFHRPLNLVGKTEFSDLFVVLKRARILVGGDSGPIHIASLTDTPVFNISFPTVSFWETGPRTCHSRVICIDEEAELPSDNCVHDIIQICREIEGAGETSCWSEARTLLPSYVIRSRAGSFETSANSRADELRSSRFSFQWLLIKAIYMGEGFPQAEKFLFVEGAQRLMEVNHVALEQIESLRKNNGNSSCSLILDRVDEVIEQIARMVPDLGPIVRWFQTERLRMGPMPIAELLTASEALHRRFMDVLSLYQLDSNDATETAPTGAAV